jgi:hypothetical protein
LSSKYKILLAILSLIGTGIILISTSRYGAGITGDSVDYISTARNIAAGVGFVTFDGTPLINQPPLYPIFLAAISYIFQNDPLLLAPIGNAFIFGINIFLSGLLLFRYLTSSATFVFLGVVAMLVSKPLFQVSVMAWSDPLFICFVLLFLIYLHQYLARRSVTSLILISLVVAMSCLTRILGVTLILTGAISILLLRSDSLKVKLSHLLLFALISTLPISIWATRNYLLSGTISGPHGASIQSLQYMHIAFYTLKSWYIPQIVSEHLPILALLSIVIGIAAVFRLKRRVTEIKCAILRASPAIIFVIVYLSVLVVVNTILNMPDIRRYLSPVFIPATVLLLRFFEGLALSYKERLSYKLLNLFLVAGISLWLIYPISTTASDAENRFRQGAGGLNSRVWRESQTIQYLEHQTVLGEHTIYSNSAEALYILTNITAKRAPFKTHPYIPEIASDISSLEGVWPKEEKAYVVWFDEAAKTRTYYFTIDELRTIAKMVQVIQLDDGTVYLVSRK